MTSEFPPLFDDPRDDAPVLRPTTPLRMRVIAKQMARDEQEWRAVRRRALSFVFQRSVAVPVEEARRQADAAMRAQRFRDAANASQDRLMAAVRAAQNALSASQMPQLKRCIDEAAQAYREVALIVIDMQHTGAAADAGRYQQTADLFGSNLQDVMTEAGNDAAMRHFEDSFVAAAAAIDQYRVKASSLNISTAPTQ